MHAYATVRPLTRAKMFTRLTPFAFIRISLRGCAESQKLNAEA